MANKEIWDINCVAWRGHPIFGGFLPADGAEALEASSVALI
jgi:hypothetical protein